MSHPPILESNELAEQILEEALGQHPSWHNIPWPERILGILVAIVLFTIMSLTFVNVFMRYVFVSPITGSEEIVQFGMAILIFSALPLVTYSERHISVGLLQGKLPNRATWFQRLFILTISMAALAIMVRQLAEYGRDLAQDRITTTVLELHLAPLSYFMSAFSAVTFLTLVILLVRHLKQFPSLSDAGDRP